jgi:mycothiol synthase
MHIDAVNNLNDEQLKSVQELVSRCQAHEGSQARFFWDNSLNLYPDMPNCFLCTDDGAVIGVLSAFTPMSDIAEITAFVAPERRRQGVFKSMLREALAALTKYGYETLLFVHETKAVDARGIIQRWPVKLERSEYAMSYDREEDRSVQQPSDSLRCRVATVEDADAMTAVAAAAFDETPELAGTFVVRQLANPDILCFVAEYEGECAGVCNAHTAEEPLSINGLGVSPRYRQKGVGRALVRFAIRELERFGKEITLEVDSTNPVAFHLYTTNGFAVTAQFDYYRASPADMEAVLA